MARGRSRRARAPVAALVAACAGALGFVAAALGGAGVAAGAAAPTPAGPLTIATAARVGTESARLVLVAPPSTVFRDLPASALAVRAGRRPAGPVSVRRLAADELAVVALLAVPVGDPARASALGAVGELALLLDEPVALGLLDTGAAPPVVVSAGSGRPAVRAALRASAAASSAAAPTTGVVPAAGAAPALGDVAGPAPGGGSGPGPGAGGIGGVAVSDRPLDAAIALFAAAGRPEQVIVSISPTGGGYAVQVVEVAADGVARASWRRDIDGRGFVDAVQEGWAQVSNRYEVTVGGLGPEAQELEVELAFEDVRARAVVEVAAAGSPRVQARTAAIAPPRGSPSTTAPGPAAVDVGGPAPEGGRAPVVGLGVLAAVALVTATLLGVAWRGRRRSGPVPARAEGAGAGSAGADDDGGGRPADPLEDVELRQAVRDFAALLRREAQEGAGAPPGVEYHGSALDVDYAGPPPSPPLDPTADGAAGELRWADVAQLAPARRRGPEGGDGAVGRGA